MSIVIYTYIIVVLIYKVVVTGALYTRLRKNIHKLGRSHLEAPESKERSDTVLYNPKENQFI